MTYPNVTVYIPTYNASSMLKEVIEGLENSSLKPDEIIIVDDGSTDGSGDIAKEHQVRLIQKSKNEGLAAARNTALAYAKNELVACIDSDVLVDRNWLSELMTFMQNNPHVSAVGGRLDEKYNSSLPDAWRQEHMQQHWGDSVRDDIPFIFGANGLYRKQALLNLGGFNPLFHTNGEDSNICRRLKENGQKIAYLPRARCWHLKTDSVSSLLRAYWKWMRHPICIEWPIDNWLSLFRFCRKRFVHHVSKNILHDLRSGKFKLLAIDVLVLFYSPYMEILEFLGSKKRPQPLLRK